MSKLEKDFDIRKFQIRDDFWTPRQRLISDTVISYQEKVLNDELPDVEKSHALANFRIAAGMEQGEFYGMVFQDSDVAKWLEGVAYSLAISPDPELEKRADAIIDIIAAAQQPDGYLDTYFILKEPDKKFQNLQECHELYCAGHMMEAAAAYYEATGKDILLKVMEREIDCIDRNIGPEEGKIHGIPGHEEVEIGLLRMYRVTGRQKEYDLAAYFINQRGTNPSWFAEETEKRGWIQWDDSPHDTEYNQSYAPVREQKEARGHSVRAMYLYTAMADYAKLSGDQTLADACETLWNNVTERQMYLTGGIGQAAKWEGFTHDYDLPNDTAYAETCASIGLMMFAHQMLKLKKNGKYADVMERALYNGVLPGMQLDGKRFFYVNPLEVVPGISEKMPGYEHVLPNRPEWFPCACCPPNVVRLITSLGRYVFEEEDHVIYQHLFVGGEAAFEDARISIESKWPWEGKVTYRFAGCSGKEFTLAVHIPSYIKEVKVLLNGSPVPEAEEELTDGYLYLKRTWKERDCLELLMDLPVRRTYCNPLVRANENCVALQKGPLVYCFEEKDNGAEIQELRVPRQAEFAVEEIKDGVLKGLEEISFKGIRKSFPDSALYAETEPVREGADMKAIPYFAWSNRGENQMRIWMPEE